MRWELEGTLNMVVAMFLVLKCLQRGVWFALEHPERTIARKTRVWVLLLPLESVFEVFFEQCAWLHRPSDWLPSEGDVRIRKGSVVLSNFPPARTLGRRCCDQLAHAHVIVQDRDREGRKRAEMAAQYPDLMRSHFAAETKLFLESAARGVPEKVEEKFGEINSSSVCPAV